MQCVNAGIWFRDREFPPTDISIGPTLLDRDGEEVIWCKASEVVDEQAAIFHPDKAIDPTDIAQGSLGDCYFMAALSAIAERPERIKRIFCNDLEHLSSTGVYGMHLCVDGGLREVVVDDRFPCLKQEGIEPWVAYGKSKHPELWVMLLEKAYAKCYGNYESIVAGQPGDAMADLLGAPYKTFKTDSKNDWSEKQIAKLWEHVKDSDAKDYVMCCSCADASGKPWLKPTQKQKGLINGHAYSLIHACELSDGTRLLGVRNPHGRNEWNGDWGDDSELWTRQFRDEIADFLELTRSDRQDYEELSEHDKVHCGKSWTEKADDGAFWMCVEDWVKYFDDVQICYHHDNWTLVSYMDGMIELPPDADQNVDAQGRVEIKQSIKFEVYTARLFLSFFPTFPRFD